MLNQSEFEYAVKSALEQKELIGANTFESEAVLWADQRIKTLEKMLYKKEPTGCPLGKPLHIYELQTEDGGVITMGIRTPESAATANQKLQSYGASRQWVRVSNPITKEDCE